jgi:hypothetical protein
MALVNLADGPGTLARIAADLQAMIDAGTVAETVLQAWVTGLVAEGQAQTDALEAAGAAPFAPPVVGPPAP